MSFRPSLLLGLLLALTGTASADEQLRSITVEGTATVDAAPDIARVSLAVERRNPSMRAAREAVVRVSQDFLALCARLGVKESKVRSTGLTIQPEYRYDNKGGPPTLTGYFVQRQLEVELTNLDKLGELMEGAVDAGVNQVSPPALDSSKRHDLNRQALAAAAEDARGNAQRIAETLGLKLGPLRTLNAADMGAPPPMPMLRMKVMAADAAAPAASYTAGEIAVESRVSATFDVVVP